MSCSEGRRGGAVRGPWTVASISVGESDESAADGRLTSVGNSDEAASEEELSPFDGVRIPPTVLAMEFWGRTRLLSSIF